MSGNHSKLFDIIAPIYAKFFDFQVNYYDKILYRAKKEIDITKYKTVLDIGCGTGALCYVLHKNDLLVTGVDVSEEMIKISMKRLVDTNVKLYKVELGENLPFEDNSFDIVISSYVAHGLKSDQRITLYNEASRVAKEKVIFHDYNKNKSLITIIVEWIENGDYFNFIKVAQKEMQQHFKEVKMIDVDKRATWYILKP